jgi:hypothetical protein
MARNITGYRIEPVDFLSIKDGEKDFLPTGIFYFPANGTDAL